ncbi:hypothetical protein FQA47_010202 [Oryzias melastigma]|uniref:Uncharacterized protein n=1 Tax=Oryzias melastigma TaxID=30732 RepID=A0A834KX29_ORYME|nr:hypothetical protein FQA47_010202 [Oryzias melastigma]
MEDRREKLLTSQPEPLLSAHQLLPASPPCLQSSSSNTLPPSHTPALIPLLWGGGILLGNDAHAHTNTQGGGAWPIAETDVPFSNHITDTQVFFPANPISKLDSSLFLCGYRAIVLQKGTRCISATLLRRSICCSRGRSQGFAPITQRLPLGPTCRGKSAAAPVGGCDRIRRQTLPLTETLFAQSGGDRRVCVAASEREPKGISLPSHTHSQIKQHIVPRRLSHTQVELQPSWEKKAQKFIRLQLRRAATGSSAVAKCCQEAELQVRWGRLLLMSMACLLTA